MKKQNEFGLVDTTVKLLNDLYKLGIIDKLDETLMRQLSSTNVKEKIKENAVKDINNKLDQIAILIGEAKSIARTHNLSMSFYIGDLLESRFIDGDFDYKSPEFNGWYSSSKNNCF